MGSRNSNAGNASVEEAAPETKIVSVVTMVNCNSNMIRLCLQQLLHMFFSQGFVSCLLVMQTRNISTFKKKAYKNLKSFQHLLLNSVISVSFLNFCRKNRFILVLVVWYVCSLVFTFSGMVFHIGTALLKKPFFMN